MDETIERGRNWLAGVLIVGALGAAVALAVPLVQRPAAPPVQMIAAAPPSVVAELQVHIAGAVVQPGLYALPAGSRVGDAVSLAGAADDADLGGLNLAARLADGQRLAVPRQGEQTTTSTASGGVSRRQAPSVSVTSGKVNLNTATAAELDALPGIGPSLAARILEHRDRHGPFTDARQLRDAKLLPAATYERLRDLVIAE